jgi:hypothetical protein
MGGFSIDAKIMLAIVAFICFLASVSALTCYECNVWKAGYGNLCSAPRNRSGCLTCMKIETTVFMGFYKNTPRTSTIISRTCALSKAVPHTTGCIYRKMSDGHNNICYCNNADFCNSASRPSFVTLTGIFFATVAFIFRNFAA